MGHEQDVTELKTDNSTSYVIINNTVQQKHSRDMDMIFYWVKDRVEQDQFNAGWVPGDTNMGDYFTNHHPPAHHKRMRAYYLHDTHSPMIIHDTRLAILRGCVDTPPISRPNRAPSALQYGPEHSCTISQSHYRHTSIVYAHTTGYSITPLSQMIHRKPNRSVHTQQCNHTYTHI
jgi:hypothetical protein